MYRAWRKGFYHAGPQSVVGHGRHRCDDEGDRVGEGVLGAVHAQVQEDSGADGHAEGGDDEKVLDRVGVVIGESDGSTSSAASSRGGSRSWGRGGGLNRGSSSRFSPAIYRERGARG